jgi:hypothetical protein
VVESFKPNIINFPFSYSFREETFFFVLTKLKYKFYLTFQIHLIDLTSSPQYYLEAKNTDLVTVDVANVRAGSNLDWTLIFLRDKNVDRSTDLGETELKSPSADIHIVDPDHISIEIDPYKSWIVLVGNQ